VTVDGDVSMSAAFLPKDLGVMEASSAANRRSFEDDGWIAYVAS
jgi:hypothetical protein